MGLYPTLGHLGIVMMLLLLLFVVTRVALVVMVMHMVTIENEVDTFSHVHEGHMRRILRQSAAPHQFIPYVANAQASLTLCQV